MGSTSLAIQDSAAQTATANGNSVAVPNITQMTVIVDVTAASGTSPTLEVFLQASCDGGVTWADLPYLMRMTDNNTSATEGKGGFQPDASTAAASPVENAKAGRNINGQTTISAVARFLATYREFPDYVRARWVIGGTTPSFTFSVKAVGK